MEVIDDSHTDRIQYSGLWTVQPHRRAWNMSMHDGNRPGSSLEYSFDGVEVQVYGAISATETMERLNRTAPVSRYFIDGAEASDFTGTPGPGTQARFDQLFFDSGVLSKGLHTLRVELVEGGHFLLDYILVKSDEPASASFPSTYTPSGVTSEFASQSSEATPSLSDPGSKPVFSTGAIIGIVVGCLAFILFILGLGLYLRRRSRKKAKPPVITVEPYSLTFDSGVPPLYEESPVTPVSYHPGVKSFRTSAS